jgi:hypothetical protein
LNFLYAHKPSKVITTAPTARQVYSLLWSEIRTAHGRGTKLRPLGGEPLKTRLELAPDWYAEGFSTTEYDTERVQGYHSPNILIIVDEASGVADNIFDSLEGLMATGNAHMLLIGNPNRAEGRFYEAFSSPLYKKFRISAFDTPNFQYYGITRDNIIDGTWEEKIGGRALPRPYLVSPEWAAERITVWGQESLLVKTKIDAQFPEGDQSDLVIPLSFLDGAEERFIGDEKSARVHLGVDVARYGADSSTIAVRAGRAPLFERILHQKNLMAIVGAIQETVHNVGSHRIDSVKVDVIGMGSGPVDRLLELQGSGGFPATIEIIGVNVAMSARNKKRYTCQRDELYWKFREGLQEGRISTYNMSAEALSELSAHSYEMTSQGKVKISSKEALRKVGSLGRSPDRSDAWVLAFAEDVVPEKMGRRSRLRVVSARRR